MAWRTSGNKYGAIKTEYNGVVYHSKKEAKYAQELDLRVRGHDIKSWEGQIKCPIVVNKIKICTYIVDFKILHNDDTEEYIEVKGKWTSTARLKVKLFRALYPDYKLSIE